MRKITAVAAAVVTVVILFVVLRTSYVRAEPLNQAEPDDAAGAVLTLPTDDPAMLEQGMPQSDGDTYLANPVPPVPTSAGVQTFAARQRAERLPAATTDECYEYIVNPGFETTGGWFGQPSSNVGFDDTSWWTGTRSAFLNTNFYSNSALWQTIKVPADLTDAGLEFHTAAVFADPGETVYLTIYNEAFTELIFSAYIVYTRVGVWKTLADGLPVNLLAGRTVQLTFQMEQDYDGFYSQVVFDDVSLVLCTPDGSPPPPPITPTPMPQPTTGPPTATPTPRPTLLPTSTPRPTAIPNTPVPGANIDLAVLGVQVGQTLMADVDPVTGLAVPLIAGKPALARVYVDVSGTDSIDGLDGELFVRDAQGVVHTVTSLNGPIQLVGDSTEGSAGSTLNFLLDIEWLQGEVDIWAEVDPANTIAESNENNNVTNEITRVFRPGPKLRVAWVEASAGVDRQIAQTSDSDIRRFYPAAVNDIEYFFQPGFNQPVNAPLTGETYPQYINALNRFWDRMSHEGRWVGGAPPDRLYGWAGGQPTGLCGVADAVWAGGRGRVATGYALSCGAETLAHELGHILDNFGLRHSPNRPNQQDANCIAEPAGPEPQYPIYPNLPLGSIGVVGFDASQLQIRFPDRTYDFMSYCAPEWISPFNYIRMSAGFAPTARVRMAATEEVTTKLLVSGIVSADFQSAVLDPFYVIRSDVAPDATTGDDVCIELRDESGALLDTRCFDLGFVNIETGEQTETDGFSLVAPYPDGLAQVVLTHDGETLASRDISANQPFVRLTSPFGGADLAGDEVTVAWNAADLDDDPLFYSLAYSIDAGASWLPLATDLTATSAVVDLNTLPGSSQVQFRVGASDGINTAYATSGSLEIGSVADTTITVIGKPPTAAIRTIASAVASGSAVVLEGTGYDLEDGLLPEAELRWWSNRDGELGAGSWLRTTLSDGVHAIVLTVTDSDGNQTSATQALRIGEGGGTIYLPIVTRE